MLKLKLRQICKTVVLCLAALTSAALAAQEKRSVAVLEPFTTGPITSLNKDVVMSNMNSSLVNTGIYKVVDRARSERVLKEQGITKRIHLSDPRKAKRLGNSLKAELICAADLVKEGGYLNAKLSIIDVGSGEVINAAQKLISKDDPDSIDRAIKEVMAELLGIKIDPPKQIADVPSSPFADLLGVWNGSYTASQGETGLTLTVFMERGVCKAKFEFYNLPGKSNSSSGSYYMEVTKEPSGIFYFRATQWIDRPFAYNSLNLRATLTNGMLSGTIPTTSYTFRVLKQGGR